MAELIIDFTKGAISMSIDDALITEDVKVFADTCFDAIALYAKKNHDYGNSFNKGMDDIGPAYGIGRIYDKVNRLVTLCKKEDESKIEESYDDTLMDLACYALMTLIHRKKSRINKVNNIKFD